MLAAGTLPAMTQPTSAVGGVHSARKGAAGQPRQATPPLTALTSAFRVALLPMPTLLRLCQPPLPYMPVPTCLCCATLCCAACAAGLATFLPATGLPIISFLIVAAMPGVLTKQVRRWGGRELGCWGLGLGSGGGTLPLPAC